MHLHVSRVPPAPVPICPGNQPLEYPALDPRSREMPQASCAAPLLSAPNPKALRDGTVAAMRRHNVRRAVLAGNPRLVAEWRRLAPDLFLAAAAPNNPDKAASGELRALHREGRLDVIAEIGTQYDGLRADDPRLEPFWSLAEELDLPVGIHLGEGMPGQLGGPAPDRYRVALTSPFQLEAVLQRRPTLRLYVMHAASPLTDEMIAMLFEYPTLYVDVAANNWNMPRAQFWDQLMRLADAGFAKRILFGSDQTLWPEAIGLAIATINEAPFLTAGQKRDILYNNAARFLRLTKEQIAQDHAAK
jgi:predicted TIM-barrel fold metal-dependent hydrolase